MAAQLPLQHRHAALVLVQHHLATQYSSLLIRVRETLAKCEPCRSAPLCIDGGHVRHARVVQWCCAGREAWQVSLFVRSNCVVVEIFSDLVAHALGQLRKLQRVEGVRRGRRCATDVRDHEGLCIAAQRLLRDERTWENVLPPHELPKRSSIAGGNRATSLDLHSVKQLPTHPQLISAAEDVCTDYSPCHGPKHSACSIPPVFRAIFCEHAFTSSRKVRRLPR